jgi:multidrug resistance efflux pump
MTTVIVLAWVGLLALLVKIKVFKKWALWMKLSPIAIWLLAQIFLLVPMGFDAPSGHAVVMRNSIQIVPPVTGTVMEVPIKSGVHLKKGDTLFQIDKFLSQAQVDSLEAKLTLAQQAVDRQAKIGSLNAGATSKADAQRVEAEVKQAEAELRVAREMLRQTTVRAPFDGFVTNIILRPGAIVVAGSDGVMSFVDDSDDPIVAQIDQINLRNIEVGQTAEIIFKYYPGRVFEARVREIIQANATGLLAPQGSVPEAFEIESEPFWVALDLVDESIRLPAGATGTVAIYTKPNGPSTLMRKIMLRMENWLNYVKPY